MDEMGAKSLMKIMAYNPLKDSLKKRPSEDLEALPLVYLYPVALCVSNDCEITDLKTWCNTFITSETLRTWSADRLGGI